MIPSSYSLVCTYCIFIDRNKYNRETWRKGSSSASRCSLLSIDRLKGKRACCSIRFQGEIKKKTRRRTNERDWNGTRVRWCSTTGWQNVISLHAGVPIQSQTVKLTVLIEVIWFFSSLVVVVVVFFSLHFVTFYLFFSLTVFLFLRSDQRRHIDMTDFSSILSRTKKRTLDAQMSSWWWWRDDGNQGLMLDSKRRFLLEVE